jgi:hypothetical protein
MLWLLLGCGDALVSGDYTGEALFTLSGDVLQEADADLPDAPFEVAVLWESLEEGYSFLPALHVETSFPGRYSITLYHPPPPDLLRDGPEGPYAIGAPVVYADHDRSASFDPTVDDLAGGTTDTVLVYIPTPLDTGHADEPVGFHAIALTSLCDADPAFEDVDPTAVNLTVSGEEVAPDPGCLP